MRVEQIGEVMLIIADVREALRSLPERSVQTVVTSPPYWCLRDYGIDGQIGLEATPAEYVAMMVKVFHEVWRVLADDGTLWMNLGDSYNGSGKGARDRTDVQKEVYVPPSGMPATRAPGLKPKDLVGIPWRVAFALQADGWYLRQDIIWSKPNPMPESVRDRCTKAHEYLFLLSKSRQYYFDQDAISEPVAESSIARLSQNVEAQAGSDRVPGKTNGTMRAVRKSGNKERKYEHLPVEHGMGHSVPWEGSTRNKRSVWEIATQPYRSAHFATYPPKLIEPCILAGSRVGDTVLDPFGGSGTTAGVALEHGRKAILIELSEEYAALVPDRIRSITDAVDQVRLFND